MSSGGGRGLGPLLGHSGGWGVAVPFLRAYYEVTHSLLRGCSGVTRDLLGAPSAPGGSPGRVGSPPPPSLLAPEAVATPWPYSGFTPPLHRGAEAVLWGCLCPTPALFQHYAVPALSHYPAPPYSMVTQLLLQGYSTTTQPRVRVCPPNPGLFRGGGPYSGLTRPLLWAYLVLYHYLYLTPGLLVGVITLGYVSPSFGVIRYFITTWTLLQGYSALSPPASFAFTQLPRPHYSAFPLRLCARSLLLCSYSDFSQPVLFNALLPRCPFLRHYSSVTHISACLFLLRGYSALTDRLLTGSQHTGNWAPVEAPQWLTQRGLRPCSTLTHYVVDLLIGPLAPLVILKAYSEVSQPLQCLYSEVSWVPLWFFLLAALSVPYSKVTQPISAARCGTTHCFL